MMLPFTGLLHKLLDGTKTMTTRIDRKLRYYKYLTKEDNPRQLDPWWTNPRTHDPCCYKIGVVTCSTVGRKAGEYFGQDDAVADGFQTVREYKVALAGFHNLPWYEVDRVVWTQMQWRAEDWIDGPHQPPEDSPLWSTMPEMRRLA